MHRLKCWSLSQEETTVIPVNLLPGLLSRSYKSAQSPRCAWLSVDSELAGGSNPSPCNRASGTDRPLPAGRHAWGDPVGKDRGSTRLPERWGGRMSRRSPAEPCILCDFSKPFFFTLFVTSSFSKWVGGQSREDEQTSVWMLPVVMPDKLLKIMKLQFLTWLQWLIFCINLTGPQSA